jgi:hypothetical protein
MANTTGWQKLGAAAYLGAPKKPSTSTTAKANRAANPTTSYGNWTGESGSWAEPGTYSGNLAAAHPEIVAGAKNPGEYNQQLYNAMTAMGNGGGQTMPTNRLKPTYTGGGGGGRGGGGGGGGGAAAPPQLTQEQLAAMWELLGKARPGAQQAGPAFDAPDYAGPQISPFDTSMYDNLRTQLGQAVTNDRAQSDQAYGALNSFMQRNYEANPYTTQQTANFGTAPGQSQDAIQRMLAMQGASPGLTQGARSDAAGADQAFGNLLGILGQNQARDYTNRQYAAQQDQANTGRMYDMAKLQGDTGIGLQQGAAKNQWQQRYDERAADIYNQQYQGNLTEQQANWQRANQLSDSNYATNNSYTNSMLSSVLGNLLPLIISGQLQVPDIAGLLNQPMTTNV